MACRSVFMRVADNVVPIIVSFVILLLVSTTEYRLFSEAVRFSHVPWKVTFSVLCAVLLLAVLHLVLYSYYKVVSTAPGFVGPVPWKYEPRYHAQPAKEGHGAVSSAQAVAHTRERGGTVLPSTTVTADGRGMRESANAETATAHHSMATRSAASWQTAAGEEQSAESGSQFSAATRLVSVPPVHANPFVVHQLNAHGRPRFCATCHVYKPDDAHHCRECGRCVYKFDHHCMFVNNCVGRNNYKLFMVFLLYSGSASLLAAVVTIIDLICVDGRALIDTIIWYTPCVVYVSLAAALLLFYMHHRILLRVGRSTLDDIVRKGGGRRDCTQTRRGSRGRRVVCDKREEDDASVAEDEQQQKRLLVGMAEGNRDGTSSIGYQASAIMIQHDNNMADVLRSSSVTHLCAKDATREILNETGHGHWSSNGNYCRNGTGETTAGETTPDISNNDNNSHDRLRNVQVVASDKDRKEWERRERRQRHREVLLGTNTRWWFDYVPIPVRTDDGPDVMIGSEDRGDV